MTMLDNARLQEDFLIWNTFEHHSRTFSFAARLLPAEVRIPTATLYLYCRMVDTIADERVLEVGTEKALEEVGQIRFRLEETLSGRPPDRLLWRRMSEIHEQFQLNIPPLFELIEGAVWDLHGREVVSETDLITYSNYVGGSVGAMMLPFLLSDRKDLDRCDGPARSLGIAKQITNIIRDVGEDYRNLKRIYIPTQWMDEYGVETGHLESKMIPPNYPLLMERLMDTAESFYDEGFKGLPFLPVKVRKGIQAAGRTYREIMNEVRFRDYDNLNHRAYVPFGSKLRLLLNDRYLQRKARLQARMKSGTLNYSGKNSVTSTHD